MKESHVTYNMPTWIECYHKDNWQKRMKKYASHNDVEWYKFAIIRNEKYENSDSFIAGFFKWKSDKLYIDRYLFRVESIYIDDVYAKSIEMYNRQNELCIFLKRKVHFFDTFSHENEQLNFSVAHFL